MSTHSEKDMKRMDRSWIFSFCGTAIGAGIIFVPLLAGGAGFYVSIVTMFIAFSVTYFAQKYYTIVIAESQNADSYNAVICEFLGKWFSVFISILFALQLFASVLVYSTGLNTDIGEFAQVYHFSSVNIANFKITPFVVLVLVTLPMLFSEKFLIKFLDKMSVVLIVLIAVLTLLFIPFWHIKDFFVFNPDMKVNFKNMLMSFPFYMGAINFYTAISPMVMYYRKNYPELSHEGCINKAFNLNRYAIYILSIFMVLFIMSSAMTLTPESLKHALDANISVLAVIGLDKHAVLVLEIIKFLGYFVIFFALTTSLYGIMLAQIEIVSAQVFPKNFNPTLKRKLTAVGIMVIVWLLTTLNINILKILSFIQNPGICLTLFIVPTFIVMTNKRFKKYRKISTIIVFLIGIFIAFSYVIGMLI